MQKPVAVRSAVARQLKGHGARSAGGTQASLQVSGCAMGCGILQMAAPWETHGAAWAGGESPLSYGPGQADARLLHK